MIKSSIYDMLIFSQNCIYVVKGYIEDEYKVIYIGKADKLTVAHRMVMHYKGNEHGLQLFGRMLHENKNNIKSPSHNWVVEVWTLGECCEYLDQRFDNLDGAEKALIKKLKPVANQR